VVPVPVGSWGAKPAWNGTFWPTVISASSLSLVRRCGVLSTFTSELCCSACSTTPNAGMLSPSWLNAGMVGPCSPARKPPNEARLVSEKDGGTPLVVYFVPTMPTACPWLVFTV
jgi:hypothetical protein